MFNDFELYPIQLHLLTSWRFLLPAIWKKIHKLTWIILYLGSGRQQKTFQKLPLRIVFQLPCVKTLEVSRMIPLFAPLGTRFWSLNCLMSSGWTYIFIDNTKSCTRMVNALVSHPSQRSSYGGTKINHQQKSSIEQFFPAREFGTFPCHHLVTPPRNRCNDHEEWQDGRKSEDTLHLQICSQSTSSWWNVVGWCRLWPRGLDNG